MRHRVLVIFSLLACVICFFGNFTTSSDRVTHPYLFSYPKALGPPNIPADNPLTIEGVWLGRLLFYDTLLSINGKMSCASCHQQKLSFTDGKALAIGAHGDTLKRNTMCLINEAWGKRFFWDGRVTTLEDLVRQPLMNPLEMGSISEAALIDHLKQHPFYPDLFGKAFPNEDISITTISKAISQFIRIIVSKDHQRPHVDPNVDLNRFNGVKDSVSIKIESISNSKDSFLLKENSLLGSIIRVGLMQCTSCHIADDYLGQIVTADENDSLFKAPTLTNAKFTAPYFHDGRFKTLREVLQFYNDNMEKLEINNPTLMEHVNIRIKFNEYDLEHADELFSSFNDTSINTNPAYSDPFKQKGFTWFGIRSPGK